MWKMQDIIIVEKASGVSALAKTLVYNRNMEICEDLVAGEKAGLSDGLSH